MRKLLVALGVILAVVSLSSSISIAGYDEALLAYQKKDFKTAFKEFWALANQGNPFAQYNLGVMYEFGQGVTADDEEAVKWYRRAANQNDGDAQHDLGAMYEYGNGVAENYSRAAQWYRRAVRNGVDRARDSLARVEKLMSEVRAEDRAEKRLSVMRFQDQVSDANRESERKCQELDVTSKMIYQPEKISFDLERQQNYVSRGRPLGWYYAEHRIR